MGRSVTRVALCCSAVVLIIAAGCHESPTQPCVTPRLARLPPSPQPLRPEFDSLFKAAGAEFRVAPELLAAVGWVETRWQMVQGAEEFPGRPAAFGVMALRGAALDRGAALAGVTPDAARRDPRANIRAAAALLAAYAAEAGGDWDAAAARFSGIDLPEGRRAYLAAVAQAKGGPQSSPLAPDACQPPDTTAAPDFPGGIW